MSRMGSAQEEVSGSWRSPRLVLLYSTVMVFTFSQIGSGLTSAIVPLYLLSLGVSLSTIGFLFSVLHLLSGLLRTPIGIISDATGPRIFLFLGLFVSTAAAGCMAFAWDWQLVALAMVLTGVSSGCFFPMMKRIIAYETDVQSRVKAFMTVGLMFSLTGIVGTALGGLISEAYGLRSVFLVALALSLLTPILFSRMHFASAERGEHKFGVSTIFRSAMDLGRNALLLSVANFLRTMTLGIYSAFTAVYLQETFSLTYGELGFYMSLSTVSGLLSAPLTGRFVSFDMRSRFIMFVQPLMLPLYLGLILSGRIDLAMVPLLIINFFGSMVGPMMDTLIGDIAPPGKVGSAYGVIDTFLRVGISAGSILGGLIIGSFGFHGVFLASGLTAAATSIPILLLRRNIAKSMPAETTN